MDKYPYIYKQDGRYYLAVAKNMYASPCRCNKVLGIHFHHNTGKPNEPITLTVDETKDYNSE